MKSSPTTPPPSSPLLTPARAVVAGVLAGYLLVVLVPAILDKLGLALNHQWFLDSYAILAANDAVRAGADPSLANPLDLLGRAHVYSDWWLGVRWLGLTREQNFLVGGLWCVAFLLVALATVRPRTWAGAAYVTLMLLAPPCLFAVQRGNNDLVIFSLLGVGLLGLRGRATPGALTVFGLGVVLATGLKYYPAVAVWALAVVLPWGRRLLWSFGLTLLVSMVVLATERSAIARGLFALPATLHEFGAPLLWRDLEPGRGTLVALGGAFLTAGALLAAGQRWTTGLAVGQDERPGDRLLFATGACLLVGCFLAGTSYSYRLVFGLWLWPWLWERRAESRAATLALVLWLLTMWADGLCCAVVNVFGLSYRPALGWRVFTQGAAWTLMVLLAGWLLDGVGSRWREWRQPRPSAPAT